MKVFKLTTVLFLMVLSGFGQKYDFYKLSGPAKLIGSWEFGQHAPVTFTSSALDNFTISQGQQGMMLLLTYKNTTEYLEMQDGSEGFIRVYEFDFDNDKDKEFIVYSSNSRNAYCRVLKISKGLVKLIGNFRPQFEVVVSKNFLSLPYGGQGLSFDYYFKNDAFFELTYHNPNAK